jgi:hypothetical protein
MGSEGQTMRRSLRAALLVAAAILFLSSFGFRISHFGLSAEKTDPSRTFVTLKHGMTPKEVGERLGPPKRIARQILYHRYLEQWIYDQPNPGRIQFDCPRGRQPQMIYQQELPSDMKDSETAAQSDE